MIADTIVDRLSARLRGALAPPRSPLVPWIVDGCVAGCLDERRARRIADFDNVFVVGADVRFHASLDTRRARTQALDVVVRTLAAEGELSSWRDERYAVAARLSGPTLFEIERAAARFFGIATYAAHVNGTTPRAGATRMWIARRSPTKSIDPGLLDNLVGGGIAAGASIAQTVVKEAWEEAGIPANLSAAAVPAGVVRIFREQPDGIQRETIHIHDLALPDDFEPRNQDGEVTEFRRASIDEVATWLGNDSGDDVVTADAGLVIVDWLLRHKHIDASYAACDALAGLRYGERWPA